MGGLISGFILFSTVTTATAFGIGTSYWAINGILTVLAPQPSRPAVLVTSETHASGD